MAAAELARQGWHLTDEGIAKCSEAAGSSSNSENIIKQALNSDLRDIGSKWLNEEINKGRLDYVEGPSVLQLVKLRVVTAPKDNEDSQVAPKLCRLSLTDGHINCSAVTLETVKGIGPDTAPGTKVLLSGTAEVETNFLLLTSKNVKLLGGRVEKLAGAWALKKSLAQQSIGRATLRGEGGPPPFVPFGTKIGSEPAPSNRRDNFKSLGKDKEKKTEEENSEFQQQRQATIKEALQAKSNSGGVKTFGGGQKQHVNDKDVARITEMGFSPEEAVSALKASSGNVTEAINSLLSGSHRNQRFRDKGNAGPRGTEGKGESKKYVRDHVDDSENVVVNTKPSGPATLFDFLETKIPTKEESKKTTKPVDIKPFVSTALHDSSSQHDTSSKYNNRNSRRPQTSQSSYAHQSHNQNRPYSSREGGQSRGYHGNQEGNYHRPHQGGPEPSFSGDDHMSAPRRHTVLPPRFARQKSGPGKNEAYDGDGGDFEGRSGKDGRNDHKFGGYQGHNQEFTPLHENSCNQQKGGRGQQNAPADYNQGYRKDNYQYNHQGFTDGKRNGEDRRRTQHYDKGNDSEFNRGQGGRNEYSSSTFPRSNHSSNQFQSGNNPRSGKMSGQNDRRDFHENHSGPQGSSYKSHRNSQFQDNQFYGGHGYRDSNHQNPNKQRSGGQYSANNGQPFQVGDTCMAKYWEDNKFYHAVIQTFGPGGNTVVVRFIDYGNHEEVLVSDVQTLNPGWQYHVPPMYDMQDSGNFDQLQFPGGSNFVPPMQFTRGQSYHNSNQRHNNPDRRKPTQAFYTAPNQR